MRKIAVIALALVATGAFAQTNFNNLTNVRVPGTGTGSTTAGKAGLYPIPFVVSGMGINTTQIRMTLNWGTALGTAGIVLGEEHTFADDVDIMLVSPTGRQLIFLSDAGGGNDWNGTFTFRDGFAAVADGGVGQNTGGNMNPGTYGVSQYLLADQFDAPAPAPSYVNTTFAGAFNGFNPNGTWNMYIMDVVGGDAGWLMSSTLTVSAVPEPASIAVLGLGAAALLRRRRRSKK